MQGAVQKKLNLMGPKQSVSKVKFGIAQQIDTTSFLATLHGNCHNRLFRKSDGENHKFGHWKEFRVQQLPVPNESLVLKL